MKNKYTTIRISKELLETVKTYSEVENKSMTEFLNDLLSDALSEYFLIRSGGAVMTIPNPQIEPRGGDHYKDALNCLAIAAADIGLMDVSLTPLLHKILAFYNQRLFFELPEDVETYKTNLIVDSTRCDNITEHTEECK